MSASWRPLLDGAVAVRAIRTASDVASSIRDRIDAGPAWSDSTLGDGLAGMALLFAYVHRVLPDQGWDATALRCVDRSATLLATTRTSPRFFDGFPGTAWAITHAESFLRPGGRDRGAAIDNAVASYLERTPWSGDYDLISGLVGEGVYALERLPRPAAVRCAELVVERLGELAERQDGTATWRTPLERLPQQQRELAPEGYYNLGLAHGVPAVIALLGALCEAKVAGERAGLLLDQAIRWLLAQRWADAADSGFPPWIECRAAEPGGQARLAWCYGDLGLAAALLVGARGAGSTDAERVALAIARRAGSRARDAAGVVDAGLCHGAAGAAHVFNRLWQASDDDSLGDAARAWAGRALEMRADSGGVAGYRRYTALPAEPWRDDPGLLSGAAGVALALLAAASDVEPEWDRVMLLSVSRGEQPS